jgi:hypothetical protein
VRDGEGARRSRLVASAVDTPERFSPSSVKGNAAPPPAAVTEGNAASPPAAVTDDESEESEIEDLTRVSARRSPRTSARVSSPVQGLAGLLRGRSSPVRQQSTRDEVRESALGKRADGASDAPAGRESAKQRKTDERAAAKLSKEYARRDKAAQAEAAKQLKAQAREQARLDKEAAKAALKLRKANDKEEKRLTSGKRAHENVFVTVCARAAGDAADDTMRAILAALEDKFPGQTRASTQLIEGAITFQRFVFTADDAGSEGDCVAGGGGDGSGCGGGGQDCVRREETAPQVIFSVRSALYPTPYTLTLTLHPTP